MNFIYLFLLPLALAQDDDDLVISTISTVTVDDANDDPALFVITDADFDDQPTRINNNEGEYDLVNLEYEGREYQITAGNLEEVTSFIQMPSIFLETKLETKNFIRDPLPTGFQYLLVTSFTDEKLSGKVTVISRTDPGHSNEIISNLNKPTGICLDETNRFLYVADSGDGKLYQYDYYITYELIEIGDSDPKVVYSGSEPYDCSVDEYGNVYVADKAKNEIYILYYSDLYWGFSDISYSAYSGLYLTTVSSPVGLEIEENSIYWVNSENGQIAGTVIKANLDDQSTLSEQQVIDYSYDEAWGVAADTNKVYYSVDTNVYSYNFNTNEKRTVLSGLYESKGLCIEESELYIVDRGDGQIYMVYQFEGSDKLIQTFANVQGAYNIFCANNAVGLYLALLILIIN